MFDVDEDTASSIQKSEIPFKSLLNREISEYPTNVLIESDPKYIQEYKGMILFDVNISEYRDSISKHLSKVFDSYRVGMQATGESKPIDLLEKIRLKIFQLYKLKIKTHDTAKGLTIKFEGFSDYLLGNYPLKDYKRINRELKVSLPMIKICLTEIPLEHKDKNFPPLYFMKPGEVFDFEKLRDSSLMYCYVPKKKDKEIHSMTRPPCAKTMQDDGKWEPKELSKIFYTNRKNILFKSKNSILRSCRTDNSIKNVKTSDIKTPFKFKVVGFEKLWNIFDCLMYNDEEKLKQEQDRNNFTYQHRFLKPNLGEKIDADLPDVIAMSVLSRYHQDIEFMIRDFCSNFNNFGCNFYMNESFKNLNFEDKSYVPCSLFLKCHLYVGSQKLAKPVCTKKIYYSNCGRFDQWITFEGIRYCDLPRNAKICMDIVLETVEYTQPKAETQKRLSIVARDSKIFDTRKVYSKGINIIIGCVSFNIFDHLGAFKNKNKGFNIWPFYHHDPQLGCMKEYNAVSSMIFQAKEKKRKECHALLYLEFQKFRFPVVHDIRTLEKINGTKSLPHFDTVEDENLSKSKILINKRDQEMIQSLDIENCSEGQFSILKELLLRSSTQVPDKAHREIIFKLRYKYSKVSRALPLFLKSIDWTNPLQITEAYKLMSEWRTMEPEEAICLLEDKYCDKVIRDYAVSLLADLSEDKFYFYTPQLTQALVYEEYHCSSLSDLLIKRSLECPYSIGHAFFWYLKSNLHVVITYERFSLVIEQFCMLCGRYLTHLGIEIKVNSLLADVSGQVAILKYEDKVKIKDIKKVAIEMLHQGESLLPDRFRLTINNEIICKGFNQEGFNIFSSKKTPLLIELMNSDTNASSIRTIFKNGDDLRQDMLTIQAIRLIDEIWKENDLDLCLMPYTVIGTGFEQGFLEFVSDSVTVAEIQYKKSIWNTFSENSIKNFMIDHFKDSLKKNPGKIRTTIQEVHQNFMKSTAGYCIISYVLGLGDRHPDNIMINKNNGNLFHIDFGHFLGNTKSKYGIKRERDPFVFTKEMAKFIKTDIDKFVMAVEGGNSYDESMHKNESAIFSEMPNEVALNSSIPFDRSGSQSTMRASSTSEFSGFDSQLRSSMKGESSNDNFYHFVKICCDSFNILRKNHKRLINLFSIMTSAGMPELYEDKHVDYITNALALDLTDEQASVLFQKEIKRALATWSRVVDNFIHNVKAKYL